MARQNISKKLRFEVFKRDGFVCQYCGAHPPDTLLHADHIVSVKDGGETKIDNLVTACVECNLGKGAKPLNVVPQGLADKAAEIAEREAQIAGYGEVMEARRDRVRRFMERLSFYEVLEAAEIAHLKKPFSWPQRWRYFCGICWKKIRDKEGEQ